MWLRATPSGPTLRISLPPPPCLQARAGPPGRCRWRGGSAGLSSWRSHQGLCPGRNAARLCRPPAVLLAWRQLCRGRQGSGLGLQPGGDPPLLLLWLRPRTHGWLRTTVGQSQAAATFATLWQRLSAPLLQQAPAKPQPDEQARWPPPSPAGSATAAGAAASSARAPSQMVVLLPAELLLPHLVAQRKASPEGSTVGRSSFLWRLCRILPLFFRQSCCAQPWRRR